MKERLRFPLSLGDSELNLIDQASLNIEEVPVTMASSADWAWDKVPETLVLNFKYLTAKSAQIRPVFPGYLRFIVDGLWPLKGNLNLPKPEDIKFKKGTTELEDESFDSLPKLGRLMVTMAAVKKTKKKTDQMPSAKEMQEAAIPGIGYAPLVAWYGPVLLTRDFIQRTILQKLTRLSVAGRAPRIVEPSDSDEWPRYALAGFIRGMYQPPLRLGDDPSKDDAITCPMPEIPFVKEAVATSLTITMAIPRPSRMWLDKKGDFPNIPSSYPSHPQFNIIPARAFMRHLRDTLIDNPPDTNAFSKVLAVEDYPKSLQGDLLELGFNVVKPSVDGNPSTSLSDTLEWGVREFQIYAKAPRVAKLNTTRQGMFNSLRSEENIAPYTGFPSGRANQETRRLIQHWKDKRFRCPVILAGFEPGEVKGGKPQAEPKDSHHYNIWKAEDISDRVGGTEEKPVYATVFAADHSGYFFNPAFQISPQDAICIGTFYRINTEFPGGPVALAKHHTALDGEVRLKSLTGITDAKPPKATESTYKVVRAVAEIECGGQFDSLNAYDNSNISMGIFHWTAAIPDSELAALFAYMRREGAPAESLDAYRELFGKFGLGTNTKWGNGPAALGWVKLLGQRTHYAGSIGLMADDGIFENLERKKGSYPASYLRSWHVFYRVVMCARARQPELVGFRRANWDFARFRLRDILRSKFTPIQGKRIKEIFTSELVVAMILRWHILRPSDMVGGDPSRLVVAYQKAVEKAKTETEQPDDDDWQRRYAAALLEAAEDLDESLEKAKKLKTGLPGNLKKIMQYSVPEFDELKQGHDTFKFDDANLPDIA